MVRYFDQESNKNLRETGCESLVECEQPLLVLRCRAEALRENVFQFRTVLRFNRTGAPGWRPCVNGLCESALAR